MATKIVVATKPLADDHIHTFARQIIQGCKNEKARPTGQASHGLNYSLYLSDSGRITFHNVSKNSSRVNVGSISEPNTNGAFFLALRFCFFDGFFVATFALI